MFPLHRLTLTEKSCLYAAIRVFNKLPENIQEINDINKFKGRLSTHYK